MQCEASTAADARYEMVEFFMAILDGRDPPSSAFAYRDPPLPFSCCRRQPGSVPNEQT